MNTHTYTHAPRKDAPKSTHPKGDHIDADYIVVGAGSAGCVLAARLSDDPNIKVILLEAGSKARSPWLHIPVGYFRTMHNPAFDWCYKTEPDPGLNHRSVSWPRGKVMGGSSALNGLLYVRGHPLDYDHWAQCGNRGWDWDSLLPIFRDLEDQERGADLWHGVGGGLGVSDSKLTWPICDAWIAAAEAAGYPLNPDCNGASQEGAGHFQVTARNSLRCSSDTAFLKPLKGRSNLRIVTNFKVSKLLMQGRRCTGVSGQIAGRQAEFRAGETILSAGSLGSPHIMMLSGLGPAAELQRCGIEVLQDMPEVGANLKDHLQARIVFKTHGQTLNDVAGSIGGKIKIALEYALKRTGPMAMAASLAYGFFKTNPRLEQPDIQFHVQPWSADSPGEGVHPFSAFTTSVCQLRPESRGHLTLSSPSPDDYIQIHPNYLSDEMDRNVLTKGIKIGLDIAQQEPLASMILQPYRPDRFDMQDSELLAWARDNSTTIYHPTGTCRMGPDATAVVDDRLRVYGTEGLRIADCSIMPNIVSGNTNAPAMVVGAKCAQLVQEDRSANNRRADR